MFSNFPGFPVHVGTMSCVCLFVSGSSKGKISTRLGEGRGGKCQFQPLVGVRTLIQIKTGLSDVDLSLEGFLSI